MILIGEKIKRTIEEAGYRKPGVFYNQLHALYAEKTINRKTFYNLLNARILPREKTLSQIATLLKTTIPELRKGTDQEIKDLLKKKNYAGEFSYNADAKVYFYDVVAPFLPMKLHLKKGGQTSKEQDPATAPESLKLIWVIVGNITVVIKTKDREERRELHNGQMTSFDARQTHYFINGSKTNSIAHILHYPAENNGLYIPAS